jgi:hypothetical protein
MPGLLDRYLARTGFASQQTDEPADDSPGNLYAPLPGDPGAHGRFDDRSHTHSLEAGIGRHRRLVLTGLAAAAAAAGVAAFRRR